MAMPNFIPSIVTGIDGWRWATTLYLMSVAVLADVAHTDADLLMICGDVASGPLPIETLDVLRALPQARFVRGNADRGLVTAFDGATLPKWPGPAFDWCASQLTREHRDFLASFSEPVSVVVDGVGRVLFCHGSPRSDEEMMTAETPDSRLREFLSGVEADLVVCGHTHMPFDREAAAARIQRSAWPGVEEFAKSNVVAVPSVEDAIAFFKKAGGP